MWKVITDISEIKPGSKVRFIDNELNRTEQDSEIPWDRITFNVKEVIGNGLKLECSDNLIFHFSRFEVWEEDAKFAGVKEGDWVKTNFRTFHKVSFVSKGFFNIEPDCNNCTSFNISDGVAQIDNTIGIDCIVPAKDVIVDFGSFRGTVRKAIIKDSFILKLKYHEYFFLLEYLPESKQAEVKSLLEQMKEGAE